MSGSDSSVRRQSAGQGGGDCPVGFRTVLASPNPEAVRDLEIGEVLDLYRVEAPIRAVLARRLDGEDVGAITRDILQLRNCLERGVRYEAEVVDISGGAVTVDVRQL